MNLKISSCSNSDEWPTPGKGKNNISKVILVNFLSKNPGWKKRRNQQKTASTQIGDTFWLSEIQSSDVTSNNFSRFKSYLRNKVNSWLSIDAWATIDTINDAHMSIDENSELSSLITLKNDLQMTSPQLKECISVLETGIKKNHYVNISIWCQRLLIELQTDLARKLLRQFRKNNKELKLRDQYFLTTYFADYGVQYLRPEFSEGDMHTFDSFQVLDNFSVEAEHIDGAEGLFGEEISVREANAILRMQVNRFFTKAGDVLQRFILLQQSNYSMILESNDRKKWPVKPLSMPAHDVIVQDYERKRTAGYLTIYVDDTCQGTEQIGDSEWLIFHDDEFLTKGKRYKELSILKCSWLLNNPEKTYSEEITIMVNNQEKRLSWGIRIWNKVLAYAGWITPWNQAIVVTAAYEAGFLDDVEFADIYRETRNYCLWADFLKALREVK